MQAAALRHELGNRVARKESVGKKVAGPAMLKCDCCGDVVVVVVMLLFVVRRDREGSCFSFPSGDWDVSKERHAQLAGALGSQLARGSNNVMRTGRRSRRCDARCWRRRQVYDDAIRYVVVVGRMMRCQEKGRCDDSPAAKTQKASSSQDDV